MSKFTQGEWRYVENNTVVVGGEQSKTIAYLISDIKFSEDGCIEFPKDEYKANGRLITAAPEMYELLKALAFYIEAITKLQKEYVANEFCDYAERIHELLARLDGEDSEQGDEENC